MLVANMNLLAALLVATGAFGQDVATPAGPKIACDEPTYNFGQQSPSQKVEHTFVVRNEGDLTLEIGNVRTSCGCTVANVSDKMLEPGESTDVVVVLDLKNRKGRQHKVITVECNDRSQPRYRLQLQGEAVSNIDLQPSRLYLGQVDDSTGATATADVVAMTGTVFQIKEVSVRSRVLEASLETVTDGSHYRVHVKTVNPMPRGPFQGIIHLVTDNDKTPTLDLNVSGVVPEALSVAPREIVMAESPNGVTRYIVVRPGKVREFKIESVETPAEGIEVNIIALPQQGGYQIRLDNVVATKELNEMNVKVITDVGAKQEILVPFRIISPQG
jgi:hypothetical protein